MGAFWGVDLLLNGYIDYPIYPLRTCLYDYFGISTHFVYFIFI